MSYNISSFLVKKIDNFGIPMSAFEGKPYTTVTYPVSGMVEIQVDEHDGIRGTLGNGIVMVEHVDLGGSGSGHAFEDVVMPALKESAGQFKARIVWEGGDTIEMLTVVNGVVTRKNLDEE